MFAYQREGLALARHNEWQCAAPNLASDNHDLALAGLFLSQPPVLAIGLPISPA
jgi:hypothetical protein